MQELIENQMQHQQQEHHLEYMVRSPQVNHILSLTPSLTPSPTISPNSNWTSLSSSQNYYYTQFMADNITYPFASHIASNSLPKSPSIHNYFQTELETITNQETHNRASTNATTNKSFQKKKKSSKSSYKHVPHREKPIHLVARRNARERRRVQAVNTAFAKLRKCVPVENRNKRLSKVKTLHRAIEYISALQDLLRDTDENDSVRLNMY